MSTFLPSGQGVWDDVADWWNGDDEPEPEPEPEPEGETPRDPALDDPFAGVGM